MLHKKKKHLTVWFIEYCIRYCRMSCIKCCTVFLHPMYLPIRLLANSNFYYPWPFLLLLLFSSVCMWLEALLVFQYTTVIHAQVTFALVHTAALGLSQMADDRCPQLLLPLVGLQSLPPNKKELAFPSSPKRPSFPICPALMLAHNLLSIVFFLSSVCPPSYLAYILK